MTPVFQRIVDIGKGDCMQCSIASLFDETYENTPAFITYKDGWYKPLMEFMKPKGYDYDGCLYNTESIRSGNAGGIRFGLLGTELKGVNGYWYASVYSPRFFDPAKGEHDQITHAVIIDKDLNIVHDPNPAYKGLAKYPMADEIGYNGIKCVFMLERIKEQQ